MYKTPLNLNTAYDLTKGTKLKVFPSVNCSEINRLLKENNELHTFDKLSQNGSILLEEFPNESFPVRWFTRV